MAWLRAARLLAILVYAPSATAQTPDRRFEEIRRFAIPEARQAPAADERNVFGIENAVIAKYDKRSGERVGEWSQSDVAGIIHLNSGIVLDGVLYAARQIESFALPPEIVERFEDRSNSGGAWWPDGYLYATGHDAADIYVLRLPDRGSVLELIEIVPAPAEGQGIAWDPAEPDLLYTLVRSRREIVVSRMVR